MYFEDKMEYLCEFAIEYIDNYKDMKVVDEDYSCDEFADIDRCIKIIIEKLQIDKKDIEISEEIYDNQITKVISFRLNGRLCEFYEIIGNDNDYLGVRLMPFAY